ncbi:TIGR02757 family protein [Vaginella massiliensis]|uniref:TIGR02757 family protein n=1 Tax=Vaginella massiliensis TaxID=1816680 RepID=UPI000838D942|nr:TIGR02757 family protein [Vaginella massiliensis]
MTDLQDFLEEKVRQYNTLDFIETDPIQIPHRYSLKEDIEISGFLTATIAWGNRKMIIKNANQLTQLMGNSPYDFVMNFSDRDLDKMQNFVHRTFNGTDLQFFMKSLRNIYQRHGGLEEIFTQHQTPTSMQNAIAAFKTIFFELEHAPRTTKHISDPLKNSAAKRLNMMLRWFVRKDAQGVDFGIWNSIPMSILSCPLDVHSGNTARDLGLLTRKQNDAKALAELDMNLRQLDAHDPVKYDFALFGLGAIEKF